jgi:2-succinyl-6-hydroxy-2,4-cyclohexadiene-1-carboxylate synthase
VSAEGSWRPLAGPLAARVRGSGPRIVFVHGFTQTGNSWADIAERLCALGYQVALVDLPGHGDSARVRADLRRTADLIASTTGAATYVGYSLGGRVALHLAIMYPHIVERLALVGATPGIVDDDERSARRTADEALAARVLEIGVEAFLAEWTAQPLFAGLEVTDAELADRLRNTADGLASSLRLCGTGTQVPLWERLVELNMPVLAMAGEHDAKFHPLAERIAATVPDGRFAAIHGAGHAAHLQQPGQVAARLEIWLAETWSAATPGVRRTRG